MVQANDKIQCGCGGAYTHKNKLAHLRTKKHKAYEAPVAEPVEIIEEPVEDVAPVLAAPRQNISVNVYDPVAVILMMVKGLNKADTARLMEALRENTPITPPVEIVDKPMETYSDIVYCPVEDEKEEDKSLDPAFGFEATTDSANMYTGGTFRKFHMDTRDIQTMEEKKAYQKYKKEHTQFRKSEERRILNDYRCGIEGKETTEKTKKEWAAEEKKAKANDLKEDKDAALYEELLDRDFKSENEIIVYLQEREIRGIYLSEDDAAEYKRNALHNLKNNISRF